MKETSPGTFNLNLVLISLMYYLTRNWYKGEKNLNQTVLYIYSWLANKNGKGEIRVLIYGVWNCIFHLQKQVPIYLRKSESIPYIFQPY